MSFRTHLTAVAAALVAFSVQAADGIPTQAYDAGLAAQLPASVQKAGVLRNVVTGNFAPYTIANPDNSIEGVPHPKHRHGRGKPLKVPPRFGREAHRAFRLAGFRQHLDAGPCAP